MVPAHSIWNSVVYSLTGLTSQIPSRSRWPRNKVEITTGRFNAVGIRLNTTPLLISAFEMEVSNHSFFFFFLGLWKSLRERESKRENTERGKNRERSRLPAEQGAWCRAPSQLLDHDRSRRQRLSRLSHPEASRHSFFKNWDTIHIP